MNEQLRKYIISVNAYKYFEWQTTKLNMGKWKNPIESGYLRKTLG